MLDVLTYGAPVLRKKAKEVDAFDEGLTGFVRDLSEAMRVQDGVGLAAPQVGKSIRVAVVDPTGGEREPYVLVNPEITWFSEETGDFEEGCLSVPEIRLKVNRPLKVSVKAFDQSGKPYILENAEGLLARVLQHEIDHLDGILFVDRVSSLQRQLIRGKLRKMSRERRAASEIA